MDNKTVNVVRKWLCLNTHSTRCFIFQKRQNGGLGVPNCMWEYTATRQSHLTNMLNCDDISVRQMARASLLLDFKRRKVLHACGGEDSFLGFKRKTNGKLDGRAQGFGVSSDWPDLNDLCWRTGTELKWTSHSQPVEVPDAVIEDPSVIVEARLHHNNIDHLLQPRTSRQTLVYSKSPKYEVLVQSKTPGKVGKTALRGPLCITHHLQQCHHQWGDSYFLCKSTSAGSSYKIHLITVVSLHPCCMTPLNTWSQ